MIPPARVFETTHSRRPILIIATLFLILASSFYVRGLSPHKVHHGVQNLSVVFCVLCIARVLISRDEIQQNAASPSLTGPLLPLFTGALVYLPAISTYFVSDDFAHLRAMRAPLRRIAWDSLTRGQAGIFLRPVGFISLALDFRLFDHWAPGFHMISLVLHLSGVLALFLFCRATRLSQETLAVAALFFAVLPVNAEAVTWIACRFDQLATPALLWSLFAYVKFRHTNRVGYYGFWGLPSTTASEQRWPMPGDLGRLGEIHNVAAFKQRGQTFPNAGAKRAAALQPDRCSAEPTGS